MLILGWRLAQNLGALAPDYLHVYNLFSYISPLAQAIFTPIILINRFFIKIYLPLAFLLCSPLIETFAVQGIQFLLQKIKILNNNWGILLRLIIVTLIFCLGHQVPEYLNPTAYSKQLLATGLYPHFLSGFVFAGWFEYKKDIWHVVILHSLLNLSIYIF